MKTAHPRTILVLAGPGLGHYFPIAGLLLRSQHSLRVVVSAQLPASSTLARRAIQDGFEFEEIEQPRARSMLSRTAHAVVSRGLASAMNHLAVARPSSELPPTSARALFGLRSYVRENITSTSERLDYFRALAMRVRPDIVLTDTVHVESLHLLAGELDLPWIEYATGPASVFIPHRPVYPAGLSARQTGIDPWLNAMFLRMAAVRRARARNGLRRGMRSTRERGPERRVAFSVRELDDFDTAPQREFDYVGASLYRHDGAAPVAKRDAIYVTFGSTGIPRDEALLVEVTRSLLECAPGHEIVVQTNKTELVARLQALGSTNQLRVIGSRPTPAFEIYASSALVVGHGGHNTVVEALYFGAPVLLIPNLAADRMEVGRRVIENQLGTCVNYYQFDAHTFKQAVQAVLQGESIRANVAHVSHRLRDDAQLLALLDQITRG